PLAALDNAELPFTETTSPPSPPVVVFTPSPLTEAQPTSSPVPCTGLQVPLLQPPLAQALPQLPQFAGSLMVSTQPSLHSVCPPLHWQDAFTQLWPLSHDSSQEPQCAGSWLTLRHCSLQNSWPCGQTQEPALQVCPPVQALSHSPQ